ncbi:MarR family winged helix-turn-helix transcriptional regulator [Actinomadura fibrosa]|uniref:MarR family winged helix-turn-helix transcriptional regulator n=1 Tax=Actinomadura fibrosa TaxID=111802 RepID=A0ABW2XYS0_9ACTN|nr:MarR family transcriptional regulator [Actinomadura fibrosa]
MDTPDDLLLLEDAIRHAIDVWCRSLETVTEYVSPTQIRALQVLREQAGLSLRELAEALGMLPSAASRLCDRLEAAGFVTRGSDDSDGRRIALRLTRPGERLLDRITAQRRRDLGELLARMSAESRRRLLDGLNDFRAAATGH